MQTCPSSAPAALAPGPPRAAPGRAGSPRVATSPGGVNQARGSGGRLTGNRSADVDRVQQGRARFHVLLHPGTDGPGHGPLHAPLSSAAGGPTHTTTPDFLE